MLRIFMNLCKLICFILQSSYGRSSGHLWERRKICWSLDGQKQDTRAQRTRVQSLNVRIDIQPRATARVVWRCSHKLILAIQRALGRWATKCLVIGYEWNISSRRQACFWFGAKPLNFRSKTATDLQVVHLTSKPKKHLE